MTTTQQRLAKLSDPNTVIKGMEHVPTGEETIEKIASISRNVHLSFSCGKDSIGAWLALRKCSKKLNVIPCYWYTVLDLKFVEDALKYYEDFFGTHIYRIPHPSFYRFLRTATLQPPDRVMALSRFPIANVTHGELSDLLSDEVGVPRTTFRAIGVRAVDSPRRYLSVRTHGPINWNLHTFLPVWDWKKARLVNELKAAGVKLPIDYKWYGRSFDGITYSYMKPIKQYAPDDYKKILDWFPLVEADIFRRTLNEE